MRLDRFLCNKTRLSRQQVNRLLAAGRVMVDAGMVSDGCRRITPFSHVQLDQQTLQFRQAHYFMLNKPPGCVSATADPQHPTALDFFHEPFKAELHIAGRLDFNTTGLMLITNDGRWSRTITEPSERKAKVYLVETEDAIHAEAAEVFAGGMYFPFENITTQPAQLELLDERRARLTLYEGRYHQVKRMFGRFNNKVLSLHRERMGDIELDTTLLPGQYRPLTQTEIGTCCPPGRMTVISSPAATDTR